MTAALDAALESHRVAVVTAPSGFGKTTAVTAWAAEHTGDVAWLSLGPYDGDQDALDVGVLEALQQNLREHTEPASLPLLEIDPESERDAIAYRAICRYFQQSPRTVSLVVDDAHRAGEALVGGLLGALIENAPESLRIVLVGTSYLELLTTRTLLGEPGAGVGADVLAFTRPEVDELLARQQSTLTADAVLAHTQGWPIAVRLLLLAGTTPDDDGTDDLGSDIRLREYVQRHVLAAVPEETAAFIVEAAVCAEVTPDVAEAVTGRADAGDILESCAAQGLFVHRYDRGHGPLYRWNTVFAKQCVGMLAATNPARLDELHRRAATALRGFDPLAAVTHHLAAGDTDCAVDALLQHWVRLVVGTEAATVEHICGVFPDGYADDPRILLVRACAQDVLGEHTLSRTLFARAQEQEDTLDSLPGGREVRLLARLFLLDDRAASAAASAEVRRMLETSPTLGTADRAAVLYLVGWTELRHRTDPVVITEFLAMAAREAEAGDNRVLRRRALGHLVLAEAWAGRFRRAREVSARLGASDEELAAPWVYYASGGRSTGDGWVQYWSGELDVAYESFLRVVTSGSSRTSFGGVARMMLAASAAASRDPRRCRRAAAELQSMAVGQAQGVQWTAFRDAALAVLEEAAGHRDRAIAVATRYADASNVPFVALTLAGILRRSGDTGGALEMLHRHRGYADISYLTVSTRATAALVQLKRGATSGAHDLCESALDLAVQEGIRLPFCDGDLAMRQLLAAHIQRSTVHESFIAECLAQPRTGGALEQLSERESAVFTLLQTAKTLTEIGDDLGVSVNTVKSHQRSIYRKLGVSSRREVRRVEA